MYTNYNNTGNGTYGNMPRFSYTSGQGGQSRFNSREIKQKEGAKSDIVDRLPRNLKPIFATLLFRVIRILNGEINNQFLSKINKIVTENKELKFVDINLYLETRHGWFSTDYDKAAGEVQLFTRKLGDHLKNLLSFEIQQILVNASDSSKKKLLSDAERTKIDEEIKSIIGYYENLNLDADKAQNGERIDISEFEFDYDCGDLFNPDTEEAYNTDELKEAIEKSKLGGKVNDNTYVFVKDKKGSKVATKSGPCLEVFKIDFGSFSGGFVYKDSNEGRKIEELQEILDHYFLAPLARKKAIKEHNRKAQEKKDGELARTLQKRFNSEENKRSIENKQVIVDDADFARRLQEEEKGLKEQDERDAEMARKLQEELNRKINSSVVEEKKEEFSSKQEALLDELLDEESSSDQKEEKEPQVVLPSKISVPAHLSNSGTRYDYNPIVNPFATVIDKATTTVFPSYIPRNEETTTTIPSEQKKVIVAIRRVLPTPVVRSDSLPAGIVRSLPTVPSKILSSSAPEKVELPKLEERKVEQPVVPTPPVMPKGPLQVKIRATTTVEPVPANRGVKTIRRTTPNDFLKLIQDGVTLKTVTVEETAEKHEGNSALLEHMSNMHGATATDSEDELSESEEWIDYNDEQIAEQLKEEEQIMKYKQQVHEERMKEKAAAEKAEKAKDNPEVIDIPLEEPSVIEEPKSPAAKEIDFAQEMVDLRKQMNGDDEDSEDSWSDSEEG